MRVFFGSGLDFVLSPKFAPFSPLLCPPALSILVLQLKNVFPSSGFAGIATGAAMAGLRPVVEFMTWNFSMQVRCALSPGNRTTIKMLCNFHSIVPPYHPSHRRPACCLCHLDV
jgi:hypothetical protein